MRNLFLLAATAATAALTGCTYAPEPGRTAFAEEKVETMLAGRVAGRALSCLPARSRNQSMTVNDNTILFGRGRTVYRNDLRSGGCHNLGGHYALVTRSSGTGLCAGDIAQVADLSTGVTVGSCVLGDFVPYTMPRG